MTDEASDVQYARRLLDDAYAFERGQDFTAAVARARAAALSLGRFGPASSVTAADVAVATSRFAAREQAWRQEVQLRAERYRVREVADAEQASGSAL